MTEFLQWINELTKEHSPDAVVNLGDTFNDHSVIRSQILSEFRKHVLEVTKRCPYYYVLGNHDMFTPSSSKYHALQTFNEKNFYVIDEVFQHPDGITFVPYIHDMSMFPMDTKRICIAHQTFIGADYGFYRPDVGVDADKMTAEVVISGHIHKRQMFGKVIYPGTPYAQNADDVDQVKGVMLFDTDTLKYSFIDCPLPQWKSLKYEVSPELSIKDVHNNILSTVDATNNWLISISAPKVELAAYSTSKAFLAFKDNTSIRFKLDYNDQEKVDRVKIKATSMSDIVSEYVEKVYQGTIDRSVIKSKALEVLAKAKLT